MNTNKPQEEQESETITGFTPGPWPLETVATSIGSCHKIGSFPKNTHGDKTYACVYADNIYLHDYPRSKIGNELLANARLIASAPTMYSELQQIRKENEILKQRLAGLPPSLNEGGEVEVKIQQIAVGLLEWVLHRFRGTEYEREVLQWSWNQTLWTSQEMFERYIEDEGIDYKIPGAIFQPSKDAEVEAGKIIFPLELQMVVLDFIAWLESVIPLVKKSLHSQIEEKIKKLKEYQFQTPVQDAEAEAEKAYPDETFGAAIKREAFIAGWRAKEGDAVEFAEWMNDNYVKSIRHTGKYYARKDMGKTSANLTYFTIEQLYNLFKQKK